jgi:hypothetical protein
MYLILLFNWKKPVGGVGIGGGVGIMKSQL